MPASVSTPFPRPLLMPSDMGELVRICLWVMRAVEVSLNSVGMCVAPLLGRPAQLSNSVSVCLFLVGCGMGCVITSMSEEVILC